MNRWKKVVLSLTLTLGSVIFAGSAFASPYTVQSHDTMYLIAKKYGVSLNQLIQANPQVYNPNIIWPGMVLNIPDNNNASYSTSQYAQQVVNLVNQERAKAGLKPLSQHQTLTVMALDKAKDLYNNRYFDHNSPTYGSPFNMMRLYGIRYSYAGENIAKGQRTPQEVMNAWMNSPGHRQNILNPNYKSIGVAYYNGVWVQEFIG